MSAMTSTPIHELAVETDTKLAELYHELLRHEARLIDTLDDLRRLAGQRKSHQGWNGSVREALDFVPTNEWNKSEQERLLAKRQELSTAIAQNMSENQALENVWKANGRWSRFFLVLNNNGHIHRGMSCSTTYPTTQWAWLPQLSGLTEAEAVADQGEILCSMCFPSAPIAWTSGISKVSKEAKAQREIERAARHAKQNAKLLFADGRKLSVRRGYGTHDTERITTIAAAKAYLTDTFGYYAAQYPDGQLVAAVLAERLGTTPEAELAAAEKRAANRAKRGY